MSGDDRIRHCPECNLSVYNFSAMTEQDVERLLGMRQGRICARFYRRADGTILTQDCPRGFRAVVRRVSRIAGAALSAVMSVGFAAAQNSSQQSSALQGEVDQRSTGITVVVTDIQGAVIANARIVLKSKTAKVQAEGVTNQAGWLTLTGLQEKFYLMEVSSLGFQTRSENVVVKEHATTRVEVKLEVAALQGAVYEVVPVPLIQIEELNTPTKIDLQPITPVPVRR